MYDVAIIGSGIVGAACAYRLSRFNLKTVVIEKTTMSAAAQQKQTAQLFTQDTIRNQTRLHGKA